MCSMSLTNGATHGQLVRTVCCTDVVLIRGFVCISSGRVVSTGDVVVIHHGESRKLAQIRVLTDRPPDPQDGISFARGAGSAQTAVFPAPAAEFQGGSHTPGGPGPMGAGNPAVRPSMWSGPSPCLDVALNRMGAGRVGVP